MSDDHEFVRFDEDSVVWHARTPGWFSTLCGRTGPFDGGWSVDPPADVWMCRTCQRNMRSAT